MRDRDVAPLLRPDRVLIRTIPPAKVQALTVWIAPRHAIAVNRGLALFLHRIARAFSSHVIVRGPADPPPPAESETVGVIASILDWMASPVHAPLVEDWPIGSRELKTAENFTTAAERFVLGHEIGHIMHRHLIADGGHVDVRDASLADLDARPLEQETAADATAIVTSIESMQHEGMDPRAAVAGMHFFLMALALVEKVGASLVDETHRRAEDRLATCHDAIAERYGPDATILRSWAQQLDELLARLGTAALDERRRRRSAATARMERVFRETSWSRYDRDLARDEALLGEVLALMLQSPGAVVEALEQNLLDAGAYTDLIRAAPSRQALERDDTWRRHQVAHFIARHSPQQVQDTLGVVGF